MSSLLRIRVNLCSAGVFVDLWPGRAGRGSVEHFDEVMCRAGPDRANFLTHWTRPGQDPFTKKKPLCRAGSRFSEQFLRDRYGLWLMRCRLYMGSYALPMRRPTCVEEPALASIHDISSTKLHV